ncbi:MAG: efflux RND transporter periplasmic adaptor subunit [Candidatus Omnitrophota bacterium]
MNNKKRRLLYLVIPVLLIIIVFIMARSKMKKDSGEIVKEISVTSGTIQNIISTTGTVLPKNRLAIKPPVSGRVESILVKEGQKVKTGETLAWMSSTERAALLDAAQGQGQAKLKYWQEVYKPIALMAPIDGEVIVATVQPGQTVSTSDAVVVLSDQLIVRAQVDETDIGKIRLDQNAFVSLDSYPDTKIKATVEHLYYESKTVNNVTIYEVDLIPEEIPVFFRSGMNATIDFIENSKENIPVLPPEAIYKDEEGDFVLIKQDGNKGPVKRIIKLGISDDKNVEIVSGVNLNDIVIVRSAKFSLPESDIGTNPFMPSRNRKSQSQSGR